MAILVSIGLSDGPLTEGVLDEKLVVRCRSQRPSRCRQPLFRWGTRSRTLRVVVRYRHQGARSGGYGPAPTSCPATAISVLGHAVFGTTSSAKADIIELVDDGDDYQPWTFTLREGLEWHGGKPVTAGECIASIRRYRWGAHLMDQKMMPSSRTRTRPMRGPSCAAAQGAAYGPVVQIALQAPRHSHPFMMPKRVAETDPFPSRSPGGTARARSSRSRTRWKPRAKRSS